jgi:hypothetical protein
MKIKVSRNQQTSTNRYFANKEKNVRCTYQPPYVFVVHSDKSAICNPATLALFSKFRSNLVNLLVIGLLSNRQRCLYCTILPNTKID